MAEDGDCWGAQIRRGLQQEPRGSDRARQDGGGAARALPGDPRAEGGGPDDRGGRAANFAAIREGAYDATHHSHADGETKLLIEAAPSRRTSCRAFRRRGAARPLHPSACSELYELGVRRFVAVGPGLRAGSQARGPNLFEAEVMPAFRKAIGQGVIDLRSPALTHT